ncbi:GNAT family N-acetyltransferase [Streptomyces antimycoticus]|uniref:GNAT family N-acetyltransferase n=1 Tax=Streptomyces mordarskii TaxID=1226758 RepID=A0ABN1DEI3_9ACTN|nr:GNAT family N-acetyltransferase [Streptomyces antimycoticus]WJD97323.1 GNAT family N-acetyltransferase [Streptomyces antimycoticus]WTA83945.1 GNAT family N-acetyltransferase [Streptomyces antimycoticus]WTB05625.1 GNAT family N-acetyltransferase [Streptomyces antimycoticus]
MDITIRRARDEELDGIGELTAQVYLGDGLLDFGDSDPYLTTLRDARRRAAEAELLVAADAASDEVLGAVAFAVYGGAYAELARPGEGEFRMLAVRPESRRRGAAEALVRACLDRGRALGLRRIVISSQQSMTAAHRLYERLGFVRAPERDWSPIATLELTLWAFTVEL